MGRKNKQQELHEILLHQYSYTRSYVFLPQKEMVFFTFCPLSFLVTPFIQLCPMSYHNAFCLPNQRRDRNFSGT